MNRIYSPHYLTPARPARRGILMSALGAGLVGLLGCAPAETSKSGDADPDRMVKGGGLPAGWNVRPDRGDASQVAMTAKGDGFHFTMGPAGTFFNNDWTKRGDFQFSARLTQTKAPSHPISYGLMVGGKDMTGPKQNYTYFLVRNEGDYFIANHEQDTRAVIVDWKKNAAITPQGADGRQTNTLAIKTEGDSIVFLVNGTEVDRMLRVRVHTDGMYGFRIGHNLDVDADQIMS